MTKICICDDDEAFTVDLKNIISLYGRYQKRDIEIDTFFSGTDMLECVEKNTYDIVFLDIELGSIRGFDIGHKIRNEMGNEKSQVVYISAKTNYAMELFETRPLNFLVKPLKEKAVFEVLDTYYRLFGSKNEYLHYRWMKKDCVINQNDIIYIQSMGRKLLVKTIGEDIEFYSKLTDIMKQLDKNKFCQVHKSFVVNGNYISRYTSDSITMCNDTNIVISRSMKKNVRQWMLDYVSD